MPPLRVIHTHTKFYGVTDDAGKIVMAGPEVRHMTYQQLTEHASALGGDVVSVSYETQYVMQAIVCSKPGCFEPALKENHSGLCSEHKLGGKS